MSWSKTPSCQPLTCSPPAPMRTASSRSSRKRPICWIGPEEIPGRRRSHYGLSAAGGPSIALCPPPPLAATSLQSEAESIHSPSAALRRQVHQWRLCLLLPTGGRVQRSEDRSSHSHE